VNSQFHTLFHHLCKQSFYHYSPHTFVTYKVNTNIFQHTALFWFLEANTVKFYFLEANTYTAKTQYCIHVLHYKHDTNLTFTFLSPNL